MLFKREKYLKKIRPFYDASDIIKVITGVRRCGKSCLMQMIADELTDRGVKKENIIFLDLDKLEYRKIKTADRLEELIRSAAQSKELNYLFIDEVQNVSGFEDVLNGYRAEGGFSIFLTGSNSYLLSGELVTKLTGRYLEFELFPLSFEEYVQMKRFYGKAVDSNPMAELTEYVQEGGFPRTVLLDGPSTKRTYVAGVIDEIFEKDIRRRVKIKDTAAFTAVRNFVIGNFGATASISSLTEALRKTGMNLSRTTVAKYIGILTDAKILYECDRFDLKSKKALSGEKKYYLADLSFFFAINTDNRINFGPVIENILFVYARSFHYAVSIGRIGKLECDFILRNEKNDYSYVQAAYTILMNRETEDREYRPLEAIPDNYPKYVVTTDTLLQKRNGIRHVNLMNFLLGENQF